MEGERKNLKQGLLNRTGTSSTEGHTLANIANPFLFESHNQSGISLNLRTVVTSWSYCSRRKRGMNYLNDHSDRFKALRHIFKVARLDFLGGIPPKFEH